MRKLLLIISTVFIAATSFAQTHFGVHAGYNINHINSTYTPASFSGKSNWNFTWGAFVHMQATRRFAVQPELNITNYKADIKGLNGSYYKMNYVQVPVLLKLTTDVGLNLFVGPQLSFLTKATSTSGNISTDVKDALTQTDFSGIAGIEYIDAAGFVTSFRYQHGISSVYKVEAASSYKSNLSAFQLTIGYVFGSHGKKVAAIK